VLCLVAVVLVGALAAGCGGDSDAPPGSPDNPLAATHPQEAAASGGSADARSRDNEGGATAKQRQADRAASDRATQPGFEQLVDRQSQRPASRFSPCNLVTKDEAATILGASIETPFEAPQGPTCIYKGRAGSPFVTVAVQELDFAQVERRLRKRQRVDVAGRTAYCGSYGRETLYVPLDGKRVLSISSRCDVALKFAQRAIPRLRA
jgi:hypothetical protein